jgi:DNA-binding transcriptional regulator YdaS (Cro superfamily)
MVGVERTSFASDAEAFAAGVAILDGQAATARLLKVSQPKIHRLLKAGKPIWAEAVETFEAATGISRYDLRRDLFQRPSSGTAPAAESKGLETAR